MKTQVVTGGHYDVDVVLTDPTRNVLYKQIKKQYDSHTWTAAKTGGKPLLIHTCLKVCKVIMHIDVKYR